MYTLDINYKKNSILYFILSIVLFILSIIYLKCSYGVVSIYMKYISLIPFVLGVLPNYILYKIKNVISNRVVHNLYNAGVMTCICGSAIQGIFEISGAHSFYIYVYVFLTALLVFSSIICITIYNIEIKKRLKITE